ncbi:MAG: hypothetical protein ABIS14_03460 [Sphingomonas sp.]
MKAVIGFGTALLLGACGAQSALTPAKNASLPIAPYGARATPTPAQLLTASNQARPKRSDELLTTSEARRSDEFSLPPSR